MGYVDTGVDFEDEYEDEYQEKGSSSKRGDKKAKKEKKEKKKGGIHAFLSSVAAKNSSTVDESKVKASLEEDEDLKDILAQLEGNESDEDEKEEEKPQKAPANPFKRGRNVDSPSDTIAPRPIAKKPKRAAEGLFRVEKQVVKVVEPEEEDDDDYGE